jgi:O-antigen ligase
MTFYAIKRLVFVLTIAATIFHFAKPIALRYMNEKDFLLRRNVWLALTSVSFLSPSFWLFVAVAVPTFIWASRKDSNPIALYLLMLHVIPPIGFIIPIFGNNGLFPLDNFRLLSFCVLLPAAMRYRKNQQEVPRYKWGAMDVLLIIFGVLQVVLYTSPDMREHAALPDSPTNVLRRAVLFFFDTYLIYYAVSRICNSRHRIIEAAASFCLACAVMASIALFENLRHWLLYVEVESAWGVELNSFTWLSRGSELRAQASAGHALALGYLLAIGFGFWLYLKSRIQSKVRRIGVTLVLWGGLFAAFSRGPWLGAVTAYFAFFAAGPRALSRLVKGVVVAFAVGLLILMSPIGDRILDVLPVMGNTADANIVYRQRLSERGWDIALAHPFFGDQYPWPEMEDLRQGEGIIDIVNTYLGVALNYGFVGLFCFMGFIFIGMAKVYARSRSLAKTDPDFALFGTSLIACIVATLEMIASCSFILGCAKLFYVLAGLAAAYARAPELPQHQRVDLVSGNPN